MSFYDVCTDRVRKVMQLAMQEGLRFNHEVLDTHHLLLGLVKEGSGVAAHVLKKFTTLPSLRYAVAELFPAGNDFVGIGRLPETDEVRLAMEDVLQCVQKLEHGYCGTEHFLLGLLERENNAVKVLKHLAISPEDVRQETLYLLGHGSARVVPEESLAYAETLFSPEQVNVYSVSCANGVMSQNVYLQDDAGWIGIQQLHEQVMCVEVFARCVRGS